MIPLGPAETRIALALKAEVVPHVPGAFHGNLASIAAWFWLGPDSRGVGGGAQAYDGLGYAGGFSFPLAPIAPLLKEMRRAHPDYPARRWKAMLLQVGRAERDLRVSYEFEDPYRWMVTPDNYRWLLLAMRPEFVSTSGR